MSLIKTIHILTVLVSISGFVLRGIWAIKGSPKLQQRWVKITPHVNDTLLLVTGITLAVMTGQYPFVHAWLTVKIICLLLYIGLGMMVIRHGRSRQQRITSFLLAIIVFVYMLGVAENKTVLFFL